MFAIFSRRKKDVKKKPKRKIIVPPTKPRKRRPRKARALPGTTTIGQQPKQTTRARAAKSKRAKTAAIITAPVPVPPMSGFAETVTVITVNFKTPDLTFDAVTSFKNFYPDVSYILIDNGGCPKSLTLGERLAQKYGLHFISNSKNIGHGLALNEGLALVKTPYAFLLDSDTKTLQGGFLEQMLSVFSDEMTFAVGWLRYVNKAGVAYRTKHPMGHPYIHPYACLLDVGKFNNLCPFIDSGAPATRLMAKAVAIGYKLVSFSIQDYIWHKIAGTRGVFGGNCLPNTNQAPGTWHERKI